jgi:hypothetical protein
MLRNVFYYAHKAAPNVLVRTTALYQSDTREDSAISNNRLTAPAN